MLADKGAELTILNRHLPAAKSLADRIVRLYRREARVLELNEDNLKTTTDEADILINTTSVGMYPNSNETPVQPGFIKKGQVVADIVYNPLKTLLITEAEQRGAHVIGGIEMLVWQGATAFELWTGITPPVEIMRTAAIKALSSL